VLKHRQSQRALCLKGTPQGALNKRLRRHYDAKDVSNMFDRSVDL
jgi:hypothetical protein